MIHSSIAYYLVSGLRCLLLYLGDLDFYVKRPSDKRQYISRGTHYVARNSKYKAEFVHTVKLQF